MRMLYLIIFSLCLSKIYPETIDVKDYSVLKTSSFLSYSTEFTINKDNIKDGKVIRTGLCCPRYYYDLYDSNDEFVLRGITRIASLGFFNPYLIDIDIYDSHSNFIGSIEGKFITKSRAKFSFNDAHGNSNLVVYLDDEKFSLLVFSSKNEQKYLAKIEGSSFGDAGLVEIKTLSNEINDNIDFLKIFTAFVSDYQTNFVAPPKVNNIYVNPNYNPNNYYNYR